MTHSFDCPFVILKHQRPVGYEYELVDARNGIIHYECYSMSPVAPKILRDIQAKKNLNMGFTGTQHGMTNLQLRSLLRFLVWAKVLHHGDCIGADAQAATIARNLKVYLVSHPPVVNTKRAFITSDEIRMPKDYLTRNRNIVDEAELLLATPRTQREERRSGTWATIRYARRVCKPVIIIYPNGELE